MNAPRLSALFLLLLASSPAFSQPAANAPLPAAEHSGEPIAAVVNGDIISQRDVEQRTKLALLTSGLPDTPDMRSRVVGPLVRRMVDEDLKIQIATKAKIPITAADVAGQMEAIEQQNHLPAGGLVKLLASKGIEPEALRQQIRGEIAWARLVHYVLGRRVHVSEDAVQTRLDAIKANFGKPEYRAAEIFLSFDGAKDEAQVRDLAERLTDQMRQGAPFTAIAKQFNQSGAADGNLGWVSEGMLDSDLMTALARLQPNGVTPPIRTTEGYYILTLLEQRKVGEGMGSGPAIDLMTIDLNSLATAGPAERDLQMQHLRDALAPAKNCDDLAALAKQVPSAALEIKEKQPESQIPAKVLPLIKTLAPGQISEPIDTPKGRRFFAVCARGTGSSTGLPSADDIRQQMEDEQLELLTRRYALDLHRDAIIDIRE